MDPVCSENQALRDTLKDDSETFLSGHWSEDGRISELCSSIGGITAGTPKVGFQELSKTFAHSSAVVDWRGIASGQLLVLSIIVKRSLYHQD